MKRFTEFVENRDFETGLDLLWETTKLDEGWWDNIKNLGKTAAGVADAGISGIGRTGIQAVRGAGNTLGGLARTGVGAIGSIVGDEESRKWSRNQLGKGLIQTGKGLTQAVAAPISGVVRGIESGRNPFSTMKKGGKLGQMLGTRASPPARSANYPPNAQFPPTGASNGNQSPAQSDNNVSTGDNSNWNQLVQQLNQAYKANDLQQLNNIARTMEREHPAEYQPVKNQVIAALNKLGTKNNNDSKWHELVQSFNQAVRTNDRQQAMKIAAQMKTAYPDRYQNAMQNAKAKVSPAPALPSGVRAAG